MADSKVPYLQAYGNIGRGLEAIRRAQTPPRFTQDFLATKLNMSGGGARPLVPFLKRTGFLGSDGTPTDIYRRFRNESQSGVAAAEAMRVGYAPLYEVNEYIHDASDAELKGVIVQVTGSEPDSSMVKGIIGSFKALRGFADFEATDLDDSVDEDIGDGQDDVEDGLTDLGGGRIRLGYTINLNLPATSDIAVFDAIFKSLRENLM